MASSDHFAVYNFITRHFLACCSADAKGETTTVILDWFSERFTASGLVVLERNFLDVYPYIKWESSTQLPVFEPGHQVPILSTQLKEGKTSKPSYLTEPDLIALMDLNGIGTDATMAEHIQKVIDRNYVIKHDQGKGKNSLPLLIPSTLGVGLVEGYDQIGFDNSLTKPLLRKQMEEKMTAVCEGSLSKQQFVNESLEQYRRVFAQANRQLDILVTSIRKLVSQTPGE